jgi:hypothetical protein
VAENLRISLIWELAKNTLIEQGKKRI